MLLLLRLALRNASRNVRRTGLTATTVMLGVALLTVATAFIDGVFGQVLGLSSAQMGHVRLVTPEYARREALMPTYENFADVQPVLDQVRKVPGVLGAYPRVMTGVTVTVGEEIGDTFGLATGAPNEWYTEWLDADANLIAGRWLSEEGQEVVLGGVLAREAGASVGQDVVLLGQTQDGSLSPVKARVVGIVEAGNQIFDQGAFLPLETMRWMVDIDGGAVEVLVYGDDYTRAGELAERVSAAGIEAPEGVLVQAWNERQPWAGMLRVIGVVEGVLDFFIVFITALAIWNTMLMSVMERTAEIGVLRAMGLSRGGAVVLFLIEALVIASLGGLLGVALGAPGAWALETYGLRLGDQISQNANVPVSSVMYADWTWAGTARAFGLGLLMAVFGSLLPSLRAAAIQPVTAMRSGR